MALSPRLFSRQAAKRQRASLTGIAVILGCTGSLVMSLSVPGLAQPVPRVDSGPAGEAGTPRAIPPNPQPTRGAPAPLPDNNIEQRRPQPRVEEGSPRSNPGTVRGGQISACFELQPGETNDTFKPLTALIPGPSQASTKTTLTLSGHPILVFYVPPSYAHYAHLQISTSDNQGHTHIQVPLARAHTDATLSTPGLLAIALPPEQVPAMERGQTYRWTLALRCAELGIVDPKNNPSVSGTIKRVDNRQWEQAVTQLSAAEQLSFFAQKGIWHDLLMSMIALKSANPDNQSLLDAWQRMLQSINLTSFASDAIAQYCPSASCRITVLK